MAVADEPAARLVKTGGRLVKHARYYWLLQAESHLTRRLFGSMLRRIAALAVPAGSDRFVAGEPGEEDVREPVQPAGKQAFPGFRCPGKGGMAVFEVY